MRCAKRAASRPNTPRNVELGDVEICTVQHGDFDYSYIFRRGKDINIFELSPFTRLY